MADESELLAQIEMLKAQLAEAQNNPEHWKLLRHICHDLRLPLTSIKGYIDILPLMGPVNDTQKDSMLRIKKNVLRMTGMIDNLYDLAVRGDGQLQLKMETVPALEIIREAQPELEKMVVERQHTLTWCLPDSLPALNIDRKRMVQMFKILVENASWYTPVGGQITVSAETVEDHIHFAVQDNGIGIPEEDRPRLFVELLFRGDSQIVREQAGSGLGLYMVRIFAETMGGSCGVEFPEEGGSRFWFDLPQASG